MIVNPEEFREAAKYFEKFGKYDDGIVGSQHYKDYWRREADRCLNGFSSGGLRISGYYYFYLNYCRIQLVEQTFGEVHKTKATHARKVGERKESFPDFWDVDLMYFATLDIAENGISTEQWEFLNKNITLNLLEDQLTGGHHLVWLKPRGVGASFKGACLPLRNQILIPKSRSFMLANETEYLSKDGLWTKYMEYRDWINVNAKGFKRSADFKEDRTKMHIRASTSDAFGNEVGYMSEVIGVSLKNNPQKARGKRGKVILWEELGKFPKADVAWNIARPSVEELDVTFGTMVGFGTGGVEGADFESIRKMFYQPKDYNIICFDNVYDTGRVGTACGFFTPAYMNPQYKDEKGVSLVDLAKGYYDREREQAERSTDPSIGPQAKAEAPYCPQEAVLNTSENIFASDVLTTHKNYIEHSGIFKDAGNAGYFDRGDDGILRFMISNKKKPIYEYPHTGVTDISGAPVVYEVPFKVNGEIPKNLYHINVDTYRHDPNINGPIKGFRGSLGAVYVMMNDNPIPGTGRGDRIVAVYIGKPNSQDDFNKVIFDLAEYYGCEGGVAYENDEPGDLVGYAKRKKLTKYLSNEFELAYDDNLKGSKTSRGYGMHMGSGKDNKRIRQGNLYLKKWLYEVRFTDENGKEILNLHLIKDLGLLQELYSYNPDGNFDRISAMRIAVYHMQELLYLGKVAKAKKTADKSPNAQFFKRARNNVN